MGIGHAPNCRRRTARKRTLIPRRSSSGRVDYVFMLSLEELLRQRLATAFAAVAGEPVDPAVRRSQHADYQSDAALACAGWPQPARDRRAGPRRGATSTTSAPVEVSGPGFINLTVRRPRPWPAAGRDGRATSDSGVRRAERPRPSRSTTRRPNVGQGDARRAPALDHHRRRRSCRLLSGTGHTVIRAEPHRRLGHTVRHADRAPARHRRGRGRPRAVGRRPERLLPGGAA